MQRIAPSCHLYIMRIKLCVLFAVVAVVFLFVYVNLSIDSSPADSIFGSRERSSIYNKIQYYIKKNFLVENNKEITSANRLLRYSYKLSLNSNVIYQSTNCVVFDILKFTHYLYIYIYVDRYIYMYGIWVAPNQKSILFVFGQNKNYMEDTTFQIRYNAQWKQKKQKSSRRIWIFSEEIHSISLKILDFENFFWTVNLTRFAWNFNGFPFGTDLDTIFSWARIYRSCLDITELG